MNEGRYIVVHEATPLKNTAGINGRKTWYVWGGWDVDVKHRCKVFNKKPTQAELKKYAKAYGFTDHDEAFRAWESCNEHYRDYPMNNTHVISVMSFITL